MTGNPPDLEPQRDFPVRRLVAKILYGNVIVSGGLYLLMLANIVIIDLQWGNGKDIAASILEFNGQLISDLFEEPLWLVILMVPGTFLGLIWYLIARFIEGLRMKEAAVDPRRA